ncbi:branched-chain amino acid ABC transporter permease, partial [Candidatus Bathyarchaeota archaeon]|nr:branched-chain amino acid ABC transporter permease [Candidatus Bathyarchaeota archaeon]
NEMTLAQKIASLLHSKKLCFIIVAFVVAAVMPLSAPDAFFIYVLTLITIFAIYASSWNLLANSGQGSLGHAVFLGLGGFASALLGGTLSSVLSSALGVSKLTGPIAAFVLISVLLVGGLVSAGIGLLIGLACVRLKAWFLAMVTFGFSVIAESLFSQFDSVTHGNTGFPPVLLVAKGFPFYLLSLSFAAISISVMFLIMRSRMGLAFKAIRENESEARMVGINTAKYKLLAFVISTFFAGMAGGLYAFFIRYIDNSIFQPANSFTPLIMSVIGGLGTTLGPIIGSVILVSVQTLLYLPSVTDALQNSLGHFFPEVSNVGPPFSFLCIGVFLVVIVIFAPKGVTSLIQRLYNRVRMSRTEEKSSEGKR